MEEVIKKYIDERYPLKVEEYNNTLKNQKEQKLEKVEDRIFVVDDLMWQDQIENQKLKLNRLEFKVYCRNLELANRKDWRVPKYKELISLVDYKKQNPASIKKIKFINATKYWSSDTSIIEKNKNWFVDFKYGTSDVANDLEKLHIRCVREVSSKKGTY